MTISGMSIHHVMCPTDFSVHAKVAYGEAVRVARWFGAKLTLFHVIPPNIPFGSELIYIPPPPESSRELRLAKLEELVAFRDAVDHAGVPVETVLWMGDVAHEIRKAARERNADLLVMGTHGRTGIGRLVLGSVTEAILRRPPVPVLTVHRPLPPRSRLFRHVLCAVDVSEWSAGTVGFAVALCGDGAEHLTVLSVIEDLPEMQARARGHHSLEEVERYRLDLERETVAELQERIPDEARTACRIEEVVRFGLADREILAVAEDEAVDVIVMGSHGTGALERFVFGSTVRGVIRAARCPVLVVPAGHAWRATALSPLTPAAGTP